VTDGRLGRDTAYDDRRVAIHVRERGEDGLAPDVRTILAISAPLPAQTFTDVDDPFRGR